MDGCLSGTYSGTSLLWTPLGQESVSSLERCPLSQRLICTQIEVHNTIGTSETVLVREAEVSFKSDPTVNGCLCMYVDAYGVMYVHTCCMWMLVYVHVCM